MKNIKKNAFLMIFIMFGVSFVFSMDKKDLIPAAQDQSSNVDQQPSNAQPLALALSGTVTEVQRASVVQHDQPEHENARTIVYPPIIVFDNLDKMLKDCVLIFESPLRHRCTDNKFGKYNIVDLDRKELLRQYVTDAHVLFHEVLPEAADFDVIRKASNAEFVSSDQYDEKDLYLEIPQQVFRLLVFYNLKTFLLFNHHDCLPSLPMQKISQDICGFSRPLARLILLYCSGFTEEDICKSVAEEISRCMQNDDLKKIDPQTRFQRLRFEIPDHQTIMPIIVYQDPGQEIRGGDLFWNLKLVEEEILRFAPNREIPVISYENLIQLLDDARRIFALAKKIDLASEQCQDYLEYDLKSLFRRHYAAARKLFNFILRKSDTWDTLRRESQKLYTRDILRRDPPHISDFMISNFIQAVFKLYVFYHLKTFILFHCSNKTKNFCRDVAQEILGCIATRQPDVDQRFQRMQSLAFEIDDKEVVKIVYKNSDHENPKTGLFSNLDVLPQILEMLNTVQDVPNAAIVASYIKGAIMAKEILAARKAAQATRIQSGTPQSSICSVQ